MKEKCQNKANLLAVSMEILARSARRLRRVWTLRALRKGLSRFGTGALHFYCYQARQQSHLADDGIPWFESWPGN